MTFRAAVAVVTMVTSVAAGQAAPALTRLEPGTCPGCTASLELIASLGKPTDKELIPEYSLLTSLVDGGFIVSTSPTKHPLLRFDRKGNYIGMLGTIGDGPGEYRSMHSVQRARGDSISIMGEGRIVTISASSGRGRSEPISQTLQSFHHTVLGDGTVILNVYGKDQLAYATLSPKSVLKQQFGPSQPKVELPFQNGRKIGDMYATWANLAPAMTGGFWAASGKYRHHLQRLGATGTVITDITRNPAWFQPYTYADIDEKVYRLGETRTPPPAHTGGIGVDSTGTVLVLSRVADANWKKDPKAPPPERPGLEYAVERREPTGGIDRYVDGILEAYDDKSGAFIGSWRSDRDLMGLTQNGLVYTRSQDADGITTLKVYRVRIAGMKK